MIRYKFFLRATYKERGTDRQEDSAPFVEKWQKRIRVSNTTERNLAIALSEMERMASSMNLSKNLIRGRSINDVIAASLYAACRPCNVPRIMNEFADVAGVTEVTIRNRYKELTEKLGTEILI